MPFRNGQKITQEAADIRYARLAAANTFTVEPQNLTGAGAALQIAGNQIVGAQGAAVANVPAGGVGTAAGGWDTAANRDAAIASINALLARLRAATGHGLIA